MSIKPGSRIGPYEVTAPLGEGGMGVVFRARDDRLQRDVALKLLPDHLATDPDRLSRFQREAQVLASLNHPNIAQIYGLEQAGTSNCIVMELVEGETLADRFKRGPLPIDDAIQVAKQIVDALAAAHERGIVHRDLKPANIKLASDGKVKVLDFGLAKAFGEDGPDRGLSHSPTKVSGSMAGVVMGTAAYMSPEQARGKVVDARTDVWAFGCVLYEMLTARQVFAGETATDIVAKILEGQPQWDRLPVETPVPIRLLLEAALNKDAKERLPHIRDARVFLNRRYASAELPKQPITRATGERHAWVVAAVLAIALVGALVPAALYFLRAPVDAAEMRFEITLPSAWTARGPLSISPDGQLIAYVANSESKSAIWIRPVGTIASRLLAGTDNAEDLFWSADGRYLGFRADGNLKKIDISGGAATILAKASVNGGGAWNRDGVILFLSGESGLPGIARISSGGGNVTRLTTPDTSKQEIGHFDPQFLPDGRHFVFSAFAAGTPPQYRLYISSLDSADKIRELMVMDGTPSSYPPKFVAPGYLMFVRNGTLMSQPFDTKRLEMTGEPVAVAEGAAFFAASVNGAVVYQKASNVSLFVSRQLQWFDRKGNAQEKVGGSAQYGEGLKLTSDGRRVAFGMFTDASEEIWVIDLDRSVPNRLTFNAGFGLNNGPVWEPDGAHIVFDGSRDGVVPNKLLRKSANGVGTEELVYQGPANRGFLALDVSSDNQYLIFNSAQVSPLIFEIWAMPLSGDKKPFPYLQNSFNNVQAQLSPDGRWLAYSTNESGTYQIVVRTFPDPDGGRWQVTANGGMEPRWRKDGRELYYLALDGKLMAVPIRSGNAFQADEPTELFQTPLMPVSAPFPLRYDVTANGQRFLMLVPANAGSNRTPATNSAPIVAIVNWTAALPKR